METAGRSKTAFSGDEARTRKAFVKKEERKTKRRATKKADDRMSRKEWLQVRSSSGMQIWMLQELLYGQTWSSKWSRALSASWTFDKEMIQTKNSDTAVYSIG